MVCRISHSVCLREGWDIQKFMLVADNPRPRLFTKNTVQSNDEKSQYSG